LLIPGLRGLTTYYVRLWTQTPVGNTYSDSTFSTGVQLAHLTSPVDGATNVDPFANFSWTSVPNAQSYYLKVGTAPGLNDVHDSAVLSNNVTSRMVPGMLGGQTYYVQLYTRLNGVSYVVRS